MKNEAEFQQGLLEHPEDAALWKRYAACLVNQDDPRGELLRLLHTLTQAIDVPARPTKEQRLRELVAAGVQNPAPVFTNSFGMSFVWIPPGTFLMGSPESELERQDDETQHPVTLTKGFWMGTSPVTEPQWKAVTGSFSSSDPSGSNFKGKNLPTLQVSWDDCQDLVKRLSKSEVKRHRLPTEAEWEYACRAGTTTPFFFGETITPALANYEAKYVYGAGVKGRGRRKTTPAGTFPPNAWGLDDMHGNVGTWCADWYGDYPKKAVNDPLGKTPPKWRPVRVLRGGCWFEPPSYCRSARRWWSDPDSRALNQGVRVCFT